ncbi:hypothetical protein EFB08_14320 [Rufibacter latericius]|uniref:Uncharacterized protein n=1 Tax=Rufibacter latericius TaxID=2487040 RepID=A0A3M9MKD9_9BACT|nr:hypothetical protein EFB08_14320 [Rufibacter latericius]
MHDILPDWLGEIILGDLLLVRGKNLFGVKVKEGLLRFDSGRWLFKVSLEASGLLLGRLLLVYGCIYLNFKFQYCYFLLGVL